LASIISEPVFWVVVTFGTPLIIALYPLLRFRTSEKTLHLMLGFSTGVLGGVTFVDIIPEAFELARDLSLPPAYVSYGIATGFFLLLILERTQLAREGAHHGGHFHIHGETALDPRHGPIGLGALSAHGFVDGLVIPISFTAGVEVGIVVTLAIVLHQIPDSFAALSLALGTTQTKRRAFTYVLVTALDTPIGIGLGILLASIGGFIVPVGLGISAGTFIFFSASDLVPELQHRARSPLVVVSMVLGFVLVAVISLLLPQV